MMLCLILPGLHFLQCFGVSFFVFVFFWCVCVKIMLNKADENNPLPAIDVTKFML